MTASDVSFSFSKYQQFVAADPDFTSECVSS